MRQAFRDATSDTPGPVSLMLASNRENAIENATPDLELVVERQYTRVPAHRCPPEMDAVKAAAQRLRQAQRPVIVVDVGARWSGAGAEAIKLAETLSAPIATALHGYSLVPNNHPLYVGVPGSYSRASANKTLARADLVLFVGSQAGGTGNGRLGLPLPGTEVIQIRRRSPRLGKDLSELSFAAGRPEVDTSSAARRKLGSRLRRDAWVAEAKANVNGCMAEQTFGTPMPYPYDPSASSKELGMHDAG